MHPGRPLCHDRSGWLGYRSCARSVTVVVVVLVVVRVTVTGAGGVGPTADGVGVGVGVDPGMGAALDVAAWLGGGTV